MLVLGELRSPMFLFMFLQNKGTLQSFVKHDKMPRKNKQKSKIIFWLNNGVHKIKCLFVFLDKYFLLFSPTIPRLSVNPEST